MKHVNEVVKFEKQNKGNIRRYINASVNTQITL